MRQEYKLTIRFDGLDAENHEIDLFAFGESMQGIARVAATVGHLAATHEYSRYFKAHELKVLAKEPRENCFSIDVVFEFVKQHQILAGTFPAALTAFIAWVLHRATKKDMNADGLVQSLTQIVREMSAQNAERESRLLGLIETMALDLKPSVKKAFAPVGHSCRTITVVMPNRIDTFDEADKEMLFASEGEELSDVLDLVVLITELDLERGTCKTRFLHDSDDRRISAAITDPLLMQANNPYTLAMSAGDPLPVKAKALLQDGVIKKLFISDVGI